MTRMGADKKDGKRLKRSVFWGVVILAKGPPGNCPSWFCGRDTAYSPVNSLPAKLRFTGLFILCSPFAANHQSFDPPRRVWIFWLLIWRWCGPGGFRC